MSPKGQSVNHSKTLQTSMIIQGKEVQVIIRSMKRKSLRLVVTEKGDVEVKIPTYCPRYEVNAFLYKHTEWLEKRLAQFEVKQKAQFETMEYLGKTYRFQRSQQKSRQPILIDEVCYFPQNWQDEDLIIKIELWQRAQSKIVFQELIDKWWPNFYQGALIGRPVLRVKKMRSRWGSLSSKGNINLNVKLMEFDLAIIEMVVVHELCHSHYFDHSANFYRLMAEKLPNYKAIEAQLKQIEAGNAY
jgi:predicted metal-dependent hydrolase